MVDLGQTLDYRNWLKSLYEERKSQDAFFSWRYLAGRIGVDASYLVRVAQGHRHLSEEALEKLAAFAGLKGRDLEIFRALSSFNRARGEREQQERWRHLQDLRSPGTAFLPDDHVDFFRRWFPVVVRTMGSLTEYVDDPRWIASRLDPSISVEEAAQALELVKRLGMLRQGDDGRWELAEPFVSSPPSMDPSVMRGFQKQMIALAGESLERHPPELRDITTLTLALDLDDLPEARERLHTLRESLLRLSAESPSPRQVYQLNLQLFPLTRVSEGERQARRPRRKLAAMALGLLLAGAGLIACGSGGDGVAGGSGVETGNYLAVRATDELGDPVVGAVVRRLPPSDWAVRVRAGMSPVLDSAVTDELGIARFAMRAGGGSDRFEAESDTLMGWNEAFGDSAFDVALRPVRWTVLRFDSAAPAQVWAARTSLRARVVEGRAYMRLPVGIATVLAGLDSGSLRPAGTHDGETDTVHMVWSPRRFLLADFDGDMNRTLPGSIAGGGWWYASNDAHLGGSSRFLPLGVEGDLSLAQAPAESSLAGRSLRLVYGMDTAFYGHYLTTGFLFGTSSETARDLSCLDSVVFHARGHGSFQLKTHLPSAYADSLEGGISFAPGVEWRRFSLAASDFWKDGARTSLLSHLVGMQFIATKPGELWLDDLELVGCRPEEVYPELGH